MAGPREPVHALAAAGCDFLHDVVPVLVDIRTGPAGTLWVQPFRGVKDMPDAEGGCGPRQQPDRRVPAAIRIRLER